MENSDHVCNILQLSDCTMLCILSYLDATSLFNLSRTCSYFNNIIKDPQLWRRIDARDEPNSTIKVNYCCDRVNGRTSHILFRAESKYEGSLSQDVFSDWNRLTCLKILALENQRFEGKYLTMHDFPHTLEELSFKKTFIKNARMFFHGSYKVMRNLRVLILDECKWIDCYLFVSIAKYENLEILSIAKCLRMHLNSLPYLNVARHGCKSLKVLDCRFNTIPNDILVQCFKHILAIYCQSMSSYELDTGRHLIRYPSLTRETQDLIMQYIVRDSTIDQYRHLIGAGIMDLPESFLYKYPYKKCSCNWNEEKIKNDSLSENNAFVDNRSMPVDDFIDFNMTTQRFVCQKHLKNLRSLPKDFKNFFAENQSRFYSGLSDDESTSEDDSECCMFGIGTSQMIVLKVREADQQGNIPEPEVINVMRSDVQNNEENRRLEDNNKIDNALIMQGSSGSRAHSIIWKRRIDATESNRDNKRQRTESEDAVAGPSRQQDPVQRAPERNASPVREFVEIYPEPVNDSKTRLRHLSLRGYRYITDKALSSLTNLNLDLLDVTYTRVTKEGIEQFLTVNPNCRVVHPDFCVCKPLLPC